jgi:ArsR family transcriptional regulator, arsenate/arsenite/antimonite-responsive transcriptional repressor
LTLTHYFDNLQNMKVKTQPEDVTRLADMMAAMGSEARLRIMRLLLSAHPGGLVVGEIQEALQINGSTLSHHLEKLRHEDLVVMSREGTFLRYAVNTASLQTLLTFLYAECCGRSQAVDPDELIRQCRC